MPICSFARGITLCLTLLLTGVPVAVSAATIQQGLDYECPCEFAREGDTFTLTAGLSSSRAEDSGPLWFQVFARSVDTGSPKYLGIVKVTESLAAGATLQPQGFEVAVKERDIPTGEQEVYLQIIEEVDGQRPARGQLFLAPSVNMGEPFRVDNRDYLRDSDGDGVGDINEQLGGTDPEDAESTPDDPVVDVLILYSQSVPALYDGEPATRIQHEFTLANQMLADSDAGFRFRPVGAVEVEIDEGARNTNDYLDLQTQQAERHGADLVVWYRPRNVVNYGICGFARFIGARSKSGHFDFEREYSNYAAVHADCTATTLAHELGHVMGLDHSVWQGSAGTWTWSRGHAVDHDFGTIMTYGPQHGTYTRLDVFSSPLHQCVGSLRRSKPCGVHRDAVDGADAVATLNAVVFQIAAFRDSLPDADGDGFVDPVDDLPQDATDWVDTDADGIGNSLDADDDGDGVADGVDAFPLDGTETLDTDGDGVGDNADPFPMDPAESADTDGDGVGDNADAFPSDPAETLDSDGDGVGDNGDVFPSDPHESADTDGDGVGDNADVDADADGVNDDVDPFPLDAQKTDLGSYLLIGEHPGDEAGRVLASSAGDGPGHIAIGVPQHAVDGRDNAGAVYVIAVSDLASLDAADGETDRVVDLGRVTSGAGSWKLVGATAYDGAGASLAFGTAATGDDPPDLLIGAPFGPDGGMVYRVSGSGLAVADAADGETDRTIQLASIASQAGSWQLVAEAPHDRAGNSVAAVGDTNGDGKSELLIGARRHPSGDRTESGAAYLLSSGDLAAMDAADGAADGVISLGHAAGQPGSWKLAGEAAGDNAGRQVASVGDVDGDGASDIVVMATAGRLYAGGSAGSAYLVSLDDIPGADDSDGLADGVVDLGQAVSQPGSWKLLNGVSRVWSYRRISSAARPGASARWLLLGNHLVSWSDLARADANDGVADGTVDLLRLIREPGSWFLDVAHNSAFVGDVDGRGHGHVFATVRKEPPRTGILFSTAELPGDPNEFPDGFINGEALRQFESHRNISGIVATGISAAGRVDGDGLADVLLAEADHPSDSERRGRIYLLLGADVAALDRVDGRPDRRLHVGNLAGDSDNDGIGNTIDLDDDGDGFPDPWDYYPLDPDEWKDSDRDDVGDNADAFPDDPNEWLDSDGDGLGDFYADSDDDGDGIADRNDAYPLDTDNDGMENDADADDDGDGVLDLDDDLPLDGSESADTDGDGIGNNADTDDDGDGVADADDALPLDARDSVDTDGDGIGDTTDALPNDAAETSDFDGDGIGDNADTDDDNDGVADVDDLYPYDAGASMDTDGDGVPDSRDRYPTNSREWANSDGAGFGDNRDTDDDNDGVPDSEDLYPLDRTRAGLTSYRVQAETDLWVQHRAPTAAGAGDLDGDGKAEVLIGASDVPNGGVAYVVSVADLAGVDTSDGVRDGSVLLRSALSRPGTWKLVGTPGGPAGDQVLSLGDLDDDGIGEFYVSTRTGTAGLGYIISGSDLLGADSADGAVDGVVAIRQVPAQPRSWLLGGLVFSGVPVSTHPADLDGDGVVEIAVAVPGRRRTDSTGVVSVYSAGDLTTLDALDGTVDGRIHPVFGEREARWRLVGEAINDLQNLGMLMTDFGGDGRADLIVGAPGHDVIHSNEGAVYLLDSRDFGSADLADGAADGQIELGHVAAQPNSWKIVGETGASQLGTLMAAGDLDGDGRQDLVLAQIEEHFDRTIRILAGTEGNLAALDTADGATDSTITLGSISSGVNRTIRIQDNPSSWTLALTDFDGDDREDILVGLAGALETDSMAYYFASSSLFAGEAGLGMTGSGEDERSEEGPAYEVYAPESAGATVRVAIAAVGDIDDDGLGDVVLAVVPSGSAQPPDAPGGAYLITAADLPHLDVADGRTDGRIFLDSVVGTRP